MNQRMWSGLTLLKYALIQLPGIAALVLFLMLLRQWLSISPWLMWGLIGIMTAKDIILYPFVWRAYEWGNQKENNSMIGLYGVSKNRLDPSGYILVRGELWNATVVGDGSVEKGEKVIVKGIRGLTLIVEQKEF